MGDDESFKEQYYKDNFKQLWEKSDQQGKVINGIELEQVTQKASHSSLNKELEKLIPKVESAEKDVDAVKKSASMLKWFIGFIAGAAALYELITKN
jgi:hypothetical protein